MVQAASAKGEVRIEAPDRAERTIARRSAEARATVPDLELSAEAAVGEPDAITTAAMVRACAHALHEVPRANGAYRDGQFELYSRVNVGVIVALPHTYVIPTIPDADQKSLAEITVELGALTARAQSGALSAPDISGATFTLWHPGVDGISQATPLIVPPQACALAAGAVREVPVVRDAAIVAGHAMTLTLACDHRILYGAGASEFLGWVKRMIEEGTP
jgi:pyruvate dehydrogenase E2 component (dihydrolipoamide acetyltransferase)